VGGFGLIDGRKLFLREELQGTCAGLCPTASLRRVSVRKREEGYGNREALS